jgi:hypothetical protein
MHSIIIRHFVELTDAHMQMYDCKSALEQSDA